MALAVLGDRAEWSVSRGEMGGAAGAGAGLVLAGAGKPLLDGTGDNLPFRVLGRSGLQGWMWMEQGLQLPTYSVVQHITVQYTVRHWAMPFQIERGHQGLHWLTG